MADDITTLGIGVDSRPVDKGREALDKLAQAGAKAEKATEDLTSATKILNKALGESEDANKQNLSATDRFVAALKKEADTIGMATSQLRAYEAAQLKLNAAQRASVDASIKAIEAHEKNKASATQSVGVLGNLKSSIAAAAAAYVSLNAVIGGTKAVIDATIAYERLTNILKVAIGSTEGAAREITFLREESNKLGLQFQTTAEQYAKLAAASKGTALEGKATRDIFLSIANASTVLGLSADQTGGVLTAVQQIISKNKVSTEELLQIAERMPGTFSTVANSLGLTGQELSNMLQKGNLVAKDLLPALAAEWQKTFGPQAIEASKSLNSQINRFDNALNELKVSVGKTGLVDLFSGGLVAATNFVNYINTNVIPAIGNITKIPVVGTGLSALFGGGVFAALKNLGSGEVQAAGLTKVTEELDKNSEAAKKAFAEEQKFIQLLEEGKKYAEKYADPIAKITEEKAKLKLLLDAGTLSQDAYNRGVKSLNELLSKPVIKPRVDDTNKLNKAQQDSLRIESEYIKLLEIERKQRQDLIAPYKEGAKQAADRLNSMQDEIAALKLVRDRQISMKQAVELTTIARLEEKKAKATDSLVLKEIDAEIAARRKVIDLIPEYERLENQSRNAANTVSQQWIQAGRNIQSALSNSIFDFFNDGLDGMVRNLKNALLRMLAEAASLRLSESIGSVLLGGAGGSGGTGGQTIGLLASLLGAFGGAGGGIRTGGGVTTGTFSNAGGAGTAYIGGKGTAIGGSGMGVNATRGAGMGSSLMGMAAMAGPYGMIAAATIMAGMELNKKYGDYKVSGFNKFGMNGLNKTDPIAVIANQFGIKGPGEIIGKALFGRGPYKFRQQSIQGDISAGGLDGTITDVFKSKGGLLVKNKHKEFEKDIPSEIVRDIDKSIKSIYKSTGEFADNLGIDARSIDTFTKQIQLKSEKGKALDTEKVKEELDAFNEDLIKSFMPDIDNFKLTGESAGETFKRLNNELDALKTGVQNLGGSAEFAKELIMGMSIDARSAVVDIAGGIDKLLEKTQFFSENFLTPTEQIAPTIAMVNEEMAKLGFSSVTTKDQFRELVQSMEIPAETRNALLDIAPAFLQILDAAKQIKAEANQNMLTLAQEFAPDLVQGIQRDMANEVLGKFGVTVDTSREKVTELLTAFVKSGGLFSNMAGDVMEAAAAWSDFQKTLPAKDTASQDPSKDPLKKVDPMQVLSGAYSTLQRSVDAERKKLTDKYNTELGKVNTSIDNLTGSVGKLKSLSDSLKNAVDQIQPLTRGQAKFELLSAINNAKRGIFPESNDLQKVLNVLSDSNSITDAKSSFEFAREQAKTSLLMQDLGDLTDNQLSVEEKMLAAAEKQRDDLNRNFQDQTLRLDSMLTKAQEQIDKLGGIDTKILSLSQALANFAKAYRAASAAQIPEVVVPPTGNPKITNKEIVDFARAPGRTEMEIYNKAKEVGVSFDQYAKATGSNVEDLYAWAKKKGLPTFASGGYHQGGLRIVGEKGPELEYTGPSRIISNSDVSKLGGNDDLSREIKALAEKVGKTQQSLEKVVSIFNKVIVDDKGGPALSIKQRTA